MKTELSSKERILTTIRHQPADHIPLCFQSICHGGVRFIDELFPDPFKRALYYMELGVDTGINLELNNFTSNENITIKEWKENQKDEKYLLSIKEYKTPKGSLRQMVRKSEDYPHETIPLFSDFNVPPGRAVKYLVDNEEELDRLEYIIKAPARHELGKFYEFAEAARKFCSREQIMLTGTLLGVGDPMIWLSGVENVLFAAADNPGFLKKYIRIVSEWNMKILDILIEAGADMVVRRGWYECTDFWSPKFYREFLFEPLKREIETAHQAGVKYAYIMNSGATPLKELFLDLGFDILTNVEPEKNDIVCIKKTISNSIALCSGVNNYHIIEAGTEAEVEKAVIEAVETLSPNGGFILAPSDSILDTSETAKRNFYKMITVWRDIA
jgi:hypothetical protein